MEHLNIRNIEEIVDPSEVEKDESPNNLVEINEQQLEQIKEGIKEKDEGFLKRNSKPLSNALRVALLGLTLFSTEGCGRHKKVEKSLDRSTAASSMNEGSTTLGINTGEEKRFVLREFDTDNGYKVKIWNNGDVDTIKPGTVGDKSASNKEAEPSSNEADWAATLTTFVKDRIIPLGGGNYIAQRSDGLRMITPQDVLVLNKIFDEYNNLRQENPEGVAGYEKSMVGRFNGIIHKCSKVEFDEKTGQYKPVKEKTVEQVEVEKQAREEKLKKMLEKAKANKTALEKEYNKPKIRLRQQDREGPRGSIY